MMAKDNRTAILRILPLTDTSEIIQELEKVIDDDWNASLTQDTIPIRILVSPPTSGSLNSSHDDAILAVQSYKSTGEISALFVAYAVVFLVALVSNILVCYVVMKTRRLHTVTNAFLVNLAVSDLTITLFNIPFNILRFVLAEWVFGDFMCRAVNFVLMISVYVSTFTMAAIALDRYMVILYPLRPRITFHVGLIIVFITWIIAVMMSLPFAIFAKVQRVDLLLHSVARCRLCFPEPAELYERYMTLCTFLAQFVIPVTLTAVAYVQIVHKVWSRQVVGQPSVTQHVSHLKSRRRTIKMLIAVVVVFCVCWLPINLYHVLTDFHPDRHTYYTNSSAYLCCHWLAISSVCYNPLIYCWVSPAYRRDLRAAVCGWRGRRTPTVHPATEGHGMLRCRDQAGYIQLPRPSPSPRSSTHSAPRTTSKASLSSSRPSKQRHASPPAARVHSTRTPRNQGTRTLLQYGDHRTMIE